MDYKKLSRVINSLNGSKKVQDEARFGVGKSGSAEDFRKSVGNNPSSEETYKKLREHLIKDLLTRAKTEVLYWGGADRPGEYVAVGPASKYKEVRERIEDVESFIDDLLSDDENYEKIASVLGIPYEEFDPTDDLSSEQQEMIYNAFVNTEEGNGEFALCVKDWNDIGEWMFDGLCTADALVEFLIGGEGNSYGYSECPWGIYQSMLILGLDMDKFYYQNTNEDCAEWPTTEQLTEEQEEQLDSLVWSDNYGHCYSWVDGWNPDLNTLGEGVEDSVKQNRAYKSAKKVQDAEYATWVSPDYVIGLLKEKLPQYNWELSENAEGEVDSTAVYDVDAESVKEEVIAVLKEQWPIAEFDFDTSDGTALFIM